MALFLAIFIVIFKIQVLPLLWGWNRINLFGKKKNTMQFGLLSSPQACILDFRITSIYGSNNPIFFFIQSSLFLSQLKEFRQQTAQGRNGNSTKLLETGFLPFSHSVILQGWSSLWSKMTEQYCSNSVTRLKDQRELDIQFLQSLVTCFITVYHNILVVKWRNVSED